MTNRNLKNLKSLKSVSRLLFGISYNGNSLFLLARFAAKEGYHLICYVPEELESFASSIRVDVRRLSYPYFLISLILAVFSCNYIKIAIPHTGSRFLKILRRIMRVNLFVDDGFILLGFDKFLKPTDTVITFKELDVFRAGNSFPCNVISPASLIDFADNLQSVPVPILNDPVYLIVSSAELSESVYGKTVDRLGTGKSIRYIPHPRTYKNHKLLMKLPKIRLIIPFSIEAFVVNNASKIIGINIGRSFTSYFLVAYMHYRKLNIPVVIDSTVKPSIQFLYLKKFCLFLDNVGHG